MGFAEIFISAVVIAGMAKVKGVEFDCTNLSICLADAIPFCLRNGTVVISSCDAKQAVCRENAQVDETFSSCKPKELSFDCSNYDPMVCTRDAMPFCLDDGTVVRGRCLAQQAVCENSKKIDSTFQACDKISPRNLDPDNASPHLTASLSTLCLVLLASLL